MRLTDLIATLLEIGWGICCISEHMEMLRHAR